MATSFSGEGSWREPPTTGKQLVNFITCGCESTAPFLAHLAKGNKIKSGQVYRDNRRKITEGISQVGY
jgi:uncharacterized protein YjaG (DUF416 family)